MLTRFSYTLHMLWLITGYIEYLHFCYICFLIHVDFYCKHPDAPRYVCHFNLNTINFKPATITSSCSNLEGEMDVRETLLNFSLSFSFIFHFCYPYLDLVKGQ